MPGPASLTRRVPLSRPPQPGSQVRRSRSSFAPVRTPRRPARWRRCAAAAGLG